MYPAIIILDPESSEGLVLTEALRDRAARLIGIEPSLLGGLQQSDFEGAIVINCHNRTSGSVALLNEDNGHLPARWATKAKALGAAQFMQLSSFSVFGDATRITATTELRPVSPYGQSKRLAEALLATLASEQFMVTILRIPALVGRGDDKLARLIRLAVKTGFFPASAQSCPRAMITTNSLAAAVRSLIERPVTATLHAADAEPFSANMLIDQAAALGLDIRKLVLPAPVLSALRRIAPSLYRSLFTPNELAIEANLLALDLQFEPLSVTVSRMLAQARPN
jgi:nucleoside-diphosphate-sugar epimerase